MENVKKEKLYFFSYSFFYCKVYVINKHVYMKNVLGSIHTSHVWALKTARSGIEWKSGQKVPLQHPL